MYIYKQPVCFVLGFITTKVKKYYIILLSEQTTRLGRGVNEGGCIRIHTKLFYCCSANIQTGSEYLAVNTSGEPGVSFIF